MNRVTRPVRPSASGQTIERWRRGRHTSALCAALGASLALTLAACGGDADGGLQDEGQETLTVMVGRGTIQGGFLVRLGVEQEIFSEHNLDLEFAEAKSSPEIAAALASGSVDVGVLASQIALPAIAQGAEFKLVLDESRLHGQLIVGPDVRLSSVGEPHPAPLRDLMGKKVGIAAVGALQELQMIEFLNDADLKPADVEFVSVGFEGETALRSGQIDALMTIPPDEITLGEDNYQVVVDRETYREKFEDFLYLTYAMPVDALEDQAQRFCQAMKDSWDFAKNPANVDAVVSQLGEELNLTPEQATQAWEEITSAFVVDGISQKEYEATVESPLLGGVDTPSFDEAVYQGDC